MEPNKQKESNMITLNLSKRLVSNLKLEISEVQNIINTIITKPIIIEQLYLMNKQNLTMNCAMGYVPKEKSTNMLASNIAITKAILDDYYFMELESEINQFITFKIPKDELKTKDNRNFVEFIYKNQRTRKFIRKFTAVLINRVGQIHQYDEKRLGQVFI